MLETIFTLAGAAPSFTSPRLPLGISFYTFQAISYLVDVYRKETAPQKNLLQFSLYISMFPQLVAGPIVSYNDIKPQLACRTPDGQRFFEGVRRFLIGLGKKVLLANNLGILWETVKSTSSGELGTLLAWLGLAAFTLQIYFDFSGYSDMAIGLGKLFGFDLKENFNYPYLAADISEFWRRWHISLGVWFKAYVYLPLGGSRVGKVRLVRNLMAVWMLTGLWHGASWNFVIWGLYYGLLIILEKFFLLRLMERWPTAIKHIYTIFFVMFGWAIFESGSLASGNQFFASLLGFGESGLKGGLNGDQLRTFLPLLLTGMAAATPIPQYFMCRLKERFHSAYSVISSICYSGTMFLSAAYMVGATYSPFLYFRF